MLKHFPVLLTLSLILVSCASKHDRMAGSVAMKLDDERGVACLASGSAKVGDTIQLYTNDCTRPMGKEGSPSCKMVKGGEAKVTKLLNDHYAEFQVTDKTAFTEGSTIHLAH